MGDVARISGVQQQCVYLLGQARIVLEVCLGFYFFSTAVLLLSLLTVHTVMEALKQLSVYPKSILLIVMIHGTSG